ncbi:hypothetical protein Rhopal_002550-T1 [Rhodotorula paludigena]|uniref:MFS general substrate transporter n=1 Tax=Rhodotorula paludigena TaxID=86838 RepID=A0AAV5GHF0_9BASI|nr:hypothetical protein Rhopal_002550-T1 [Rhodotorula paludigena]
MSSPSSLSEKYDEGRGEVTPALLTDEEHRRLLRKIDWHILPWIYLTYCIMRIDVGNISNAGVMNSETGHSLRQTLGLSPQQWANVILVFYPTYMAFEPVSTFCIRIFSPSGWIGRIMVTWGVIMCCMAAVSSYGGLITTRVLIGAAESGYFPCVVLHWAYYYSPFELAPRILGLYAAGAAAGAASGFLSWAISFANSPPMYGWRWLFIIEGLIPVFMGVATFWVLPDFPSTCKWLTPREVEHLALHLHKDAPHETGKKFDLKESLAIFKDPTYALFTIVWVLQAVGGYGIGLVLPQIVKDMGFVDSAATNLLQIPPAAATIVFLFICSELLRRRLINAFPLVIAMWLLVIVGYILLLKISAPGVRYFAVTLVTAAAGVIYPCLWPRRIQALRGTAGAALGIGLHNASAQLSGILGPQLFRSDYAPRYINSFIAACVLVGAAIVFALPLWYLLDGDLSWSPWLSAHVQAQTHFREGDDQRDGVAEAWVDQNQQAERKRQVGGEKVNA